MKKLINLKSSIPFKNNLYNNICTERFKKEPYNMQLPTLNFKQGHSVLAEDIEEGERIIYLYNYVPLEDINCKKLGESQESYILGQTLNHLFNRCLKKEIPMIKEVCLFNFREFYDVNLKRNDVEHEYTRFFLQRFQDFVFSTKPDSIILGDPSLFSILQYNLNKKSLESPEVTSPYKFLGRIVNFDYTYESKILSIPTIATLSLTDLTGLGKETSNPSIDIDYSEKENRSSLINDYYQHFEQIVYKKNFYTISDKSTWIRKDIYTIEEFDSFYEKLIKNKKTAIDLETLNLYKFANKILTAHFALDSFTIYNLPLFHKQSPFSSDELNYITQKLKWFLEEGESEYLIFHNAKFDLSVLTAQLNLDFINHKIYDTQAGLFSLNENKKALMELVKFDVGPYRLATLAYYYGSGAYDEEGGLSKSDRTNLNNQELDLVLEYATKDAIITYQIHEFQLQEASRRKYKLWKEFVIEQLGAMIHTFIHMEVRGILIDKSYLLNLLSPESELQTLFREVKKEFEKRESCHNVNRKLLFHIHFTETLKNQVSVFEKLATKLIKKEKKNSKHLSLFAEEGIDPIPSFQEKLNKYLESCREIIKDISKSPYLLIQFATRQIETTKHENLFRNLRELISNYSEFEINKLDEVLNLNKDYWEPLLNLISEHVLNTEKFLKSFLKSLKKEDEKWVFDIAKRDSQQLLFFDELKLEIQDERKDGGGKTNKNFQKMYLNIPEVKLFEDYNKYRKLTTTYIEGMNSRMEESEDSKRDNRLRASYDYLYVVTGRSSCLPGSTKILTSKGEISIDHLINLKEEVLVLTHNGNWKPITNWIKSGTRSVYKVKTKLGKEIKSTLCHKYYIGKGRFKKLEDLKEGGLVTSL